MHLRLRKIATWKGWMLTYLFVMFSIIDYKGKMCLRLMWILLNQEAQLAMLLPLLLFQSV